MLSDGGILLLGRNTFDFDPRLRGVAQSGIVEGVPDVWNSRLLQESAMEGVGHTYKELDVTVNPPDIRVGDTIVFIYTIEAVIKSNGMEFDGEWLGLAPGLVWCVQYKSTRMFYYIVRDGALIPVGAQCVVRPILQEGASSILWTPDQEKVSPHKAIVMWAGEQCPVLPGQTILYNKFSDIPVPMEHPDHKNDRLGFWVMDGIADIDGVLN